MNYKIRELKQDEVNILNTFLYEAIFIPDGVDEPPYEVISKIIYEDRIGLRFKPIKMEFIGR